MTQNKLLPAIFLLTLSLAACDKDKNGTLNIRLTDGGGDFQQVNVDIQEIRIKTSEDTAKWLSINTNAGIYNLLDFQNGVDTLLATGPVPNVTLKEVRFILGPNNSVMVDSVIHPLQTPSAEESGLKIKVDKQLDLDINTLVLDFDAAESVKQNGNGSYKLQPVIRLK